MADSKLPAPQHGTPFAPRALVPVAVGRTSVNLYPVIDSSMPVEERAHAYQVNKTALASAPVDLRVQLDALGQQLNLAATVDGVRDDWLRYFHDSWCDFRRLAILSFHNDAGAQINDTSTAADAAILLPVIDGHVANCRRANVKFVRVQITLDFRPLVNVEPPGITTLRVEYYIELPQTSRAMLNGAGAGYTLVTFHGADDLRTLTQADVHASILDLTLQDGPYDLQPASFNLTTARTDGASLRSEIEGKILRLAYATICNTLFVELCPGYSNQPHAALDHIRQVHYDRDGNQVVSSVQAYFQQMMNASRPFSSQRDFPISVCQKFQDGLDPRLITGFRRFFPDHSVIQPLGSTHQRKILQQMLRAAQQAEDDYGSTQRIAREAIGMSQAFPIIASPAGTPARAAAFPSQAETTLTRYQGGGGYSTDSTRSTAGSSRGQPRPWNCFGCGGPHPYSEYKDGAHVVICPNRDVPGVREHAARNIEKMRKNRKKRHVQNQKRKNLGTANFTDFDEAGQKRIREQCLASIQGHDVSDSASAMSSVTGPSAAPSAARGRGGGGGGRIFVVDVPAFAASTPLKPQMPISIQSNLPHIAIKFGPDLEDSNCPTIRCAVDTCAALTTGSFHFFAAIAKRYPHCVEKVFAPQDYASIVLTGIVRKKEETVTTELEVGFQFRLPYKTSDGDDSSFMVATGPHVSVNTIVGLPFIKGVGMIIDTVDDVADCKYLDCPPFPIDYRRTSNQVPAMDEPSVPVHRACPHLLATIREIEHVERYYDAKVLALGSSSNKNSMVHFGPVSAARDAVSDTDSVSTIPQPHTAFATRWVPPHSALGSHDEYHDQVLREDGYLPPCRRVSTYSASGAFAPIDPTPAPIRVAPKPKRRKRMNNVFLDDRGFKDLSDEYDHVLKNIDGGPILRKLRHPAPDLDAAVDPVFHEPFDPSTHEALMRKDLDLSHLDPALQESVYALIRKYWSVFSEKGVFVPVKNYECVIDTGTARPISVKKILYGERETIIMRKCISALAKVGHIVQAIDGEWMFKALLAPKPHQEHIRSIDEFVWRFCVNFIPLNAVTKLIAYPIPRCDSAVFNEFGQGKWRWMFDAPMGYHQLAVAPESQEKLAFQGVDAIKWKYTVMPFGPTNGPATFINFIYDINSVWQQLAESKGVRIDEDTNTKIIIDDIVSYAKMLQMALLYMECQLIVCQAYRLSLNLRKSFIFPHRFEFVGIDVCDDGNRPAKSKHDLLQTWPQPELVRDVAKFIGFAQFYSRFIHHFELRISPLRELTTQLEFTEPVAPHWTDAAQAALADIKDAILSDPCLQRFDHRKLIVLRTDFSKDGFGYVLCQPASDESSERAVQEYREGRGFTFMSKGSSAILHPVCFGARRSRGNEIRLHSHLGEGFAGDYAINKCSHMLFGQRFVWVTDCYAIKFILSYEGGNAAILRLQMRLMCWDVDIVHRPDTELVDADYWSRLGIDLDFDPLLRGYLAYAMARRRSNPPPTDLPMRPENMPYYRGPRLPNDHTSPASADAHHIQSLITEIVTSADYGHTHLSNIPIRFGKFDTVPPRAGRSTRKLLNSEFACYALETQRFDWVVYSFSNGHFSSTLTSRNLPFNICLACDPYESGRALFHEFASSATVFPSGNDLLNHIRASGETSVVHGYLVNSHRFQTSEVTTSFWKLQLSIIAQLRLIRSLSVVVAIVIPDHDGRSINAFTRGLKSAHWVVSSRDVYYPDIGDTVADSCKIITAVHSSCATAVEPIDLRTPPAVNPLPIGSYVWEPFNRIEHSISPGREEAQFDTSTMVASTPKPATGERPRGVAVRYHLHNLDSDKTILAGSAVLSTGGLCPPFESCPNQNLFQHFFGIEFIQDGHTYVRAISTFEFARCFGLSDPIQYRISHERHKFGLDSAMPGRTSAWLFEQIHSYLTYLRDTNCEVFSPNQFAARAATIQTLVNGAICSRLPSRERWVQAYANDRELSAVRELAIKPSLITNQSLSQVNHNFRGPLRQSLISVEDDMLIFREPISGSNSYTRLTLVPRELYNILFVAFHANPIGGHLNAYRTLHRLRLRFYWPGMFAYVKRMCMACPGCALSNTTRGKSAELVYNFPIEAPFLVMHFDAYAAGKHSGFEGSDVYLIGCCGMCSFACMEPVTNPSATTFASAIMKILLRYGFCHTAVLDKDTKFYGVCREALDLLQINCHVLSGENHNPMLVERINRYLTKGLKIMCNERGSVRIANEAILLLLYAWNSCPVPGTDISRSLVAVGREFAFPIDYSSGKHWELTSTASTVVTYSKDLATRLKACHEVAQLLVQEQRAYHREFINARRPDPRVYSVGDIVFARRAVRSNAAKEQVDKLQYAFTGPWRVRASLKGASYELEHCSAAGRIEKKHAADLSPYPTELIPFQPVDGPDSRYGQLYKPIASHPFKEAGIEGFKPPTPFKVPANLAVTDSCLRFHWPSLAELNDEIAPFEWSDDVDFQRYLKGDSISTLPILAAGPPPAAPKHAIPSVPATHLLTAAIIQSTDKLFFVSHSIGSNNAREWRLVRVAFQDSMALYPSCTIDGRYLFDFYICHPSDWRYNAINQRYWLQYHGIDDVATPTLSTDTHLIRPSDTSDAYAARHKLVPFRKWLNISHLDTFIHGPFEFASIRGRKTRDRISQDCWDILAARTSMFANPLPRFDVPTYSIHVDRGAHVQFHDEALCDTLLLEASQTSTSPCSRRYL